MTENWPELVAVVKDVESGTQVIVITDDGAASHLTSFGFAPEDLIRCLEYHVEQLRRWHGDPDHSR